MKSRTAVSDCVSPLQFALEGPGLCGVVVHVGVRRGKQIRERVQQFKNERKKHGLTRTNAHGTVLDTVLHLV